MTVARSQPITQADMDSLATLANSVLLPLVNANIKGDGTGTLDTGWLFSGGILESWSGANYYDIPASTADGLQYNKSPQPAYSFSGTSANWLSELNRIRGDFWNLIFTAGLGADDILLSPDNILSGPWVVGVNDPVTFPMGSTQGILAGSIPNAAGISPVFCAYKNVAFGFDSAEDLSVAGYIRANGGLPADGTPVFGGILADLPNSGTAITLKLKINSSVAGQLTMPVSFSFVLICIMGSDPDPSAAPDVSSMDFSNTPAFGALTISSFYFQHLSENPGGEALATYSFTGTLNLSVDVGETDLEFTFTVPPAFNNGNGSYDWYLYSVSDFTFDAQLEFFNSNDKIPLAGVHPSSDLCQIVCSDYPILSVTGESSSVYGYAWWELSDPTVKGVWIANTLPVPGQNVFLDQDMPPYVGASELNFNGPEETIAVSGTLYYLNDYLDNPPTGQPNNSEPRFESSMRQQARGPQDGFSYDIPFWDDTETYPYGGGATAANGDLYYSLQNGNLNHPLTDASWWSFLVPASENSRSPKYNLINQSCQPQAAQWLVRRDTDFVPFTLGFNTDDYESVWSVQTAVADPTNTGTHLNLYNIFVAGTATAVRIRLMAPGTAEKGWQDGELQYGDDLATNLKILVRASDFPTKSIYDFATTNNEVTVDGTNRSDGGRGYLARIKAIGFNFSVQNLTGANVDYDLVMEIDYAQNPQRQYFPPYGECFSYVIDGTPSSGYPPGTDVKPIPQSGYCIFKVRATRLPVQNSAGISVTPASGDEINILLGQNILQPDGTLSFSPFMNLNAGPGAGDDTGPGAGDTGTGVGGSGTPATLTIPATGRDTGDVDVFIPVLAGNELVWQSDDDVIMEAWANWQPIFFSTPYGTGSPTFNATAFQYCLAFANQFDPYFSNFPGYGPGSPMPTVQFPPSVEIFDDLEACLNLI
jgi:hypothetical protein